MALDDPFAGLGQPEENDFFDSVGNFATNTLIWSPLSLLGVRAPDHIQKWEAENPITSTLSGLVGYALPYVGWAKALKSLPKINALAKTVDKSEFFGNHNLMAGFAKEAVRFAPFEAGRIGTAALLGKPIANALGTEYEGTGKVVSSAIQDLAFTGVIGAGGAFIKGFKGTGTKALPENVNINDSLQQQYQDLVSSVAKGEVKNIPKAQIDIRDMAAQIRRQNSRDIPGGTVVSDLDDGVGRVDVNRAMKPGKSKHHSRTQLVVDNTAPRKDGKRKKGDVEGYKSREFLNGLIEKSELPEGFEAVVQFPLFHHAKNSKGRKAILRGFSQLPSIGGGWKMAREGQTGLYVMSREFEKNRWVSFKTDKPEFFVPTQAKFAAQAIERAAWYTPDNIIRKPLDKPNRVFDEALKVQETTPLLNKTILDSRSTLFRSTVQKVMEKAGNIGVEGSEAYAKASEFIHLNIQPSTRRYANHPAAAQVATQLRQIKDAADANRLDLFYGKVLETPGVRGQSLGKAGKERLSKGNTERSLDNMIDDLYDEGEAAVESFWRATNTRMSIGQAIKNEGLTKLGAEAMKELARIDGITMDGLQALAARSGDKMLQNVQALKHHYGLSRKWKGDLRQEMKIDGKIIGYASGTGWKQVEDEIAAFRDFFAKKGKTLERGDKAYVGQDSISNVELLSNISAEGSKILEAAQDKMFLGKTIPTRLKEARTGARGYVGNLKPWTKKELKESITNQLRDYNYLNAKATSNYLLKDSIMKIEAKYPQVAKSLSEDYDKLYGAQGKISKEINRFTDSVLAPAFGPQTATRMANSVSKYLYATSLGFVNTGFNIANLATFVQTAFPHMQYVVSTLPERMAQNYSMYPMMTKNGMKQVASLNVLKITRNAMSEMRNPDKDLMKNFIRATDEGMLQAQMLEQAIGKNAAVANGLGVDGITGFMGKLATALPHATESWARTQAFAMGHVFWRDVMGVVDQEQLYQLSKKFVANTQYLYGAADRAKIITGPLGSTFGLFKNWMMNYVSWMAEYTGEAFFRGNWKPLAWGLGTTSALGGVAATPFLYGAADKMSQALTNESLGNHVYSMMGAKEEGGFRRDLADSVMFGLPAFLGISLQNQVTAPGANPLADASRFFQVAVYERGAALGQAIGNALDVSNATGENPMISNPQTFGLFMKALAPKMMYRTTQIMQDEMLRSSKTGNPVTALDFYEKLIFTSGTNPTEVDRKFTTHHELWNDQQGMRTEIASLGKAWLEAQQLGDSYTQRSIMYKALAQGIDIDRILKSANARDYKRNTPLIERSFTPEKVFRYAEIGRVD